jgi:signal transduction histidine kinase
MNRRLLSILLFIIVAMSISPQIAAATKRDSLISRLNVENNTKKRIIIMQQLSELGFGTPDEYNYQYQIYDLYKSEGETEGEFNAIAAISRYYLNNGQTDKVMLWASKINGRKIPKNCFPAYFSILSCRCTALISTHNIEFALEAALKMQDEAIRLRSVDGEILCDEVLGQINSEIGQTEKAIDAYKHALDLQKKSGAKVGNTAQILMSLIEVYFSLEDYDNVEHYLKEFKELNDKEKVDNKSFYPLNFCVRMYYGYMIQMLCHQHNYTAAADYINMASRLSQSSDRYAEVNMRLGLMLYFNGTNNFAEALSQINYIIDNGGSDVSDYFIDKAKILANMGDYDKASQCMEKAYQLLSSTNKQNYINEFHQFESKCKAKSMERDLQDHVLHIERIKYYIFIGGLILLVIAIIIIRYMSVYNKTIRGRLQTSLKELEREKTMLSTKQSELALAYRKAEDSGNLKSAFLSNMSHEIRTPLNSILGFSEIISDLAQTEDHKYYAHLIHENSEMLLLLINNILDLGRLDSGRMKFLLEECDVCEIAREASFREGRNNDIIFTLECEPKKITTYSDHMKILQIIYSMINNAYKFTKKGYVRVCVNLAGDMIITTVEDNGPGIPEGKEELIFERFENLGSFEPGTGLGLSIAKEFASRLDGRIYVDTSYIEGARFVFELKQKNEEQALEYANKNGLKLEKKMI